MRYIRPLALAALTAANVALITGCAVARDQQTVGAYIDDAAITTAVKARLVEDKTVNAGAVNVQTLNGEVALSGFARSSEERAQAERVARDVKGVRTVRNNLAIRP